MDLLLFICLNMDAYMLQTDRETEIRAISTQTLCTSALGRLQTHGPAPGQEGRGHYTFAQLLKRITKTSSEINLWKSCLWQQPSPTHLTNKINHLWNYANWVCLHLPITLRAMTVMRFLREFEGLSDARWFHLYSVDWCDLKSVKVQIYESRSCSPHSTMRFLKYLGVP